METAVYNEVCCEGPVCKVVGILEVGRMQSSLELQSNIKAGIYALSACQALRVFNSIRYYPIPFILIEEAQGLSWGLTCSENNKKVNRYSEQEVGTLMKKQLA